MLGIKIWFTAQFINAIVCTLCFLGMGIISIISIPFAAVGGIPALIAFVIWTEILKGNNTFAKSCSWLTYLVVPFATACCSFGLLALMGYDHEIVPFAIIPIPVSILSTFIFSKNISEIAQTNNDTTTT